MKMFLMLGGQNMDKKHHVQVHFRSCQNKMSVVSASCEDMLETLDVTTR